MRFNEFGVQAVGFWETILYTLNAFLFILVGLQLRPIVDSLHGRSVAGLLLAAFAITATLVATRAVWLFAQASVQRA